ncbi:type II toxin-antitoxin system ParD family antitoxin [Neorhizobium sp. SOG26]|uniref:ribbon-helix-helix domain-containing protein n=1 Tax=Neorhizobium sp. SOG26 TaxID=2060726 RepID=UPI000E56B589|nr:type II toxin-antitoxin system ParD family antitoxin [Neorhizobium sp. SOG26]AXV14714.1 type II toxin-antitoxin system ParD family antitoxin [Neorhizobium sp. SOG26]
MRPNRSITISLPEDMAELVKKKVASGEFADESEVVAEGLRYLSDRDAEIETWLRSEVVPVIETHDPSKAIPIDEVRRRISAHMDVREKQARFSE